MKRKLYLDIAVFIVILGGFGAFVFMQQHAPATEAQTQEAVDASAAGCWVQLPRLKVKLRKQLLVDAVEHSDTQRKVMILYNRCNP